MKWMIISRNTLIRIKKGNPNSDKCVSLDGLNLTLFELLLIDWLIVWLWIIIIIIIIGVWCEYVPQWKKNKRKENVWRTKEKQCFYYVNKNKRKRT